MTAFRPVNDQNAIEAVIFQLIFDTPLDSEIFAAAQARHVDWGEELPLLQLGSPDPVRLPGFLALPPQTAGLSFTRLRPDGMPAWQLRLDPHSIGVVCTRYIRWERIWKTARRYIGNALELVAEQPGDRQITTAMLQFVDRFDAPEAAYDAAALLRAGRYLPSALFELGPIWHSNMGWFEEDHPLGQILHNLNIASNRMAAPDTGMREEMISIGVTHIQELRLMPSTVPTEIEGLLDMLDGPMAHLHASNKALMADILQPGMAHRIGLSVGRGDRPA